MTVKAEIEGKHQQVKEYKRLTESSRSQDRGMEEIVLQASEGTNPADTWISGFSPSEL